MKQDKKDQAKSEEPKPVRNLREVYDPPRDNEFGEVSEIFWEGFCDIAPRWIVRILFGLLVPVLFVAFVYAGIPTLTNNKTIFYLSVSVAITIGFLSGVFGFSVKGIFKSLEKLISKGLRAIIFRDR